MNNRGQMAAYEAVIIMVLLIALGFAIWVIISKKTESNVYQPGSKSLDYNIQPHFGGCASTKVMEYMESKNAGTKVISNSSK